MSRRYVRELDSVAALCRQGDQLSHAVVQGLDLRHADLDWENLQCQEAVFLGCHFPEKVTAEWLQGREEVRRVLAVTDLRPLAEPEDFRTPEEYRQALLRGMEGDVPEEYRALKRRYYEELVHQ